MHFMSELVTMPTLMMITSMVSEESLARDTDTQTDYIKYFKVTYDFEKKKSKETHEKGCRSLQWTIQQSVEKRCLFQRALKRS